MICVEVLMHSFFPELNKRKKQHAVAVWNMKTHKLLFNVFEDSVVGL